jgi:hypothetical protein
VPRVLPSTSYWYATGPVPALGIASGAVLALRVGPCRGNRVDALLPHGKRRRDLTPKALAAAPELWPVSERTAMSLLARAAESAS